MGTPAQDYAVQLQELAATGPAGRPKKVTIICWSGELDRAYPVLILATTAAASGMDVSVFFTFWGLGILKRNDLGITGKDWRTRMLSFMERGGTRRLKLSRMHMGGMGAKMMRQVFRKEQIATLDELLALAVESGVKLLPCQMTMDAFGLRPEHMIPGVSQVCGAATALAEAASSDINWFI